MVFDGDGNLYLSDTGNHRVRRVDAKSRVITTIAGNGEKGFSGDGGPATSARLDEPYGLALDPSGNLYFADRLNLTRRRVDGQTGVSPPSPATARPRPRATADQARKPESSSRTTSLSTVAADFTSPMSPATGSASSTSRPESSLPSPATARDATRATAASPRTQPSTAPEP